MFTKRSTFRTFIVLIAILLISSSASARPLTNGSGPGTAFTYQGRLTDSGAPANGTYDFEFKLYDALTDGVLVGTDPLEDVVVSGGLFTVLLDFGAVFDGRVLYLDIGVRPGASEEAYTPLTPRQPLTPTPYALYAAQVNNADLVDGLHASAFVLSSHNHWGQTWTSTGTGLTLSGGSTGLSGSGSTYGVMGISTGSDKYGVYGTNDNGYGVYGSGLTGVYGNGAGSIGVGVSGYGSPGVKGIGTATSAGVYGNNNSGIGVEGEGLYGVYGLATDSLGYGVLGRASGGAGTNYAGYFDGNVQIEGSLGVTSTSLVTNLNADRLDSYHAGNATGSIPLSNGTLNTNLNADMLDGNHASAFAPAPQNVVFVAKSGGDFSTISAALASITDATTTNRYLIYIAPGVYNERVFMKEYVDIEGAGELNTKVTFTGSEADDTGALWGANNAELRFLTVENTGGGARAAIAIYNSSAALQMTHVTARAVGSDYTFGVFNRSCSPTMTDVSAYASGATTGSYAVYNYQAAPTLMNVTAMASGLATNVGMHNFESSPKINDSNISGSGGTANYGFYNNGSSGTYTILVNNSQISGSTNTIYNGSAFTLRIGASQLNGGDLFYFGSGNVICIGVYDENYASPGYTTCP